MHCTVFFMVSWSPTYFFPATSFIVFNALFALALIFLICSSQFNLLSSVIPKKWVLSLGGIISFLSMIYIGFLFLFLLFLNIVLTVLLGENFKLIFAAHASRLLVTKKSVTLSTLPCGIPKCVCLLCETDPPTLTLIHLSPINSLMNLNILPCIPIFSSCFSVLSLLTLS